MKKIITISCFGIILLIILIPFLIYTYYNQALEKTPNNGDELFQVEIPVGANAEMVAEILKKDNLIIDERVFVYYGRFSGNSSNILAGKFNIPSNLTIPEVYSILQKPVINELTISFPEGLRGDEIANALDKNFNGYENQEEVIFDKEDFVEIIYKTPSSDFLDLVF